MVLNVILLQCCSVFCPHEDDFAAFLGALDEMEAGGEVGRSSVRHVEEKTRAGVRAVGLSAQEKKDAPAEEVGSEVLSFRTWWIWFLFTLRLINKEVDGMESWMTIFQTEGVRGPNPEHEIPASLTYSCLAL